MDPVEAQKYFTPDECESLPEIWSVSVFEPQGLQLITIHEQAYCSERGMSKSRLP